MQLKEQYYLCSSIKAAISPKSPISFGKTNIFLGLTYFLKSSFISAISISTIGVLVLKPTDSI